MADPVKGKPAYKRVLLKLSGEVLMGSSGFGIDQKTVDSLACEISEIQNLGAQIALVIGGGNIFRGLQGAASGMDRAAGDYMGMLATVINSLALQDSLERHNAVTRVMSAIEMKQIAEPYIPRRAIRHLEKGRIVIFAAGTGNPYFSTDTAASLRAMEISAEAILKGTKVDGVYDKDPMVYSDAKRFEKVSYIEVLKRDLKVMDSTAISMCRDNSLPLVVFDFTKPGNTLRAVCGENIGTIVGE